MQSRPGMWHPFSSSRHEGEDDQDDRDDDEHADAAALRIIARWIAEHDGVQTDGAVLDRAFIVGSAPH